MKTRHPALVRLLDRPPLERRLGAFFLVEERGEGGYAPVWLAREMYGRTELRLAAIKLFALDEFGPDKYDIIEEARSLGRVNHPHIAQFYGIVIDESAGVMGLAMELLGGRSLEYRLSHEKILSIEESLNVGIAIASALAAVHQAGIVHRDVKPGNIVEDAHGVCKLIDFGIASSSQDTVDGAIAASLSVIDAGQNDEDVTAPISGMATGTPGYIDPACAGKRISPTPARDLYALGATLYRCLSGYLPAQMGTTTDGIVLWNPRVLSGKTAPQSLLTHRADVPPALAILVDKLLAPRPEHRPRGALQVEHELERIRHELGGRKRDLPPENDGPFRGLQRFEAVDRDVFFGRRDETSKALEILRGRGLVALVGSSGSGKSSLARAGLLPALAEGELSKWPQKWDAIIVEPGRDPWTAIVTALKSFIPEAPLLDTESLVAAMEERANIDDRGIVLFVDQLEELVTTSLPESRDEAAALLAAMGERAISGIRAVVAARSDLLDPLLALGELGKILSRSLCIIDPLRPIDWRESITGALAAYGYEFEDEVLEEKLFQGIDRVVDAMPLVEFALAEMWNARDKDKKRLTHIAFDKIGGIEGALELHAEATVNALKQARSDFVPIIRSVLLALTTPEGTRRSQSEDELVQLAGADAVPVIAELTKARLLVPAKEGVTVAHEALLTRWSRLQSWIAEARADRMLAEELERDAVRWTNDAESVGLWTGRRLAFARELSKKNEIRLSENAITFVRASVRASQRRNAIFVMFGAILLVAFGSAGIVYARAQQIEKERIASEQRYLEELERVIKENGDQEERMRKLEELVAARGSKTNPPEPTATAIASVSPVVSTINVQNTVHTSSNATTPPMKNSGTQLVNSVQTAAPPPLPSVSKPNPTTSADPFGEY